MNSKTIWAGVSISILTAIAQAHAINPNYNYTLESEEQNGMIAHIRPESDGGVTLIKTDGNEISFTKEQISIINSIKGKDSFIFRNSAFCSTKVD